MKFSKVNRIVFSKLTICRLIFLSLFIVICNVGFSQSGFIFKENFGADQSAAYGIIESSGYIYATGTHLIEDEGYRSIYVCKIDSSGEVLSYDLFFDLEDALFSQNLIHEMVVLDSSMFVVATSFSFRDRILEYNLKSDKIDSVYTFSPLSENEPLRIRSISSFNNELIVLFNTVNPASEKNVLQFGLDVDAKRIIIDREDYIESSQKMYPLENGNILISLSLFESDIYQSRVNFIEVDTFGNIVWEYLHESPSIGCKDFLKLSNGDLIATFLEFNINEEREGRPVIVKISSEGEILWKSTIGGNLWSQNLTDNWYRVIENYDSDGFMICGENTEAITLDSSETYGVIAKISSDGDSLWYKRFSVVTNEPVSYHSITDLEKSSNGYIASGRVTYKSLEEGRPALQSYFIKIDNDGNINSDTTSTNDFVENSLSLNIKIYPNPVSDYFYIEQTDVSNIKYQLLDSQGRLFKQFNAESSNQVLIVPVANLVKGSYFLKALSGRGEVSSWSIFVE